MNFNEKLINLRKSKGLTLDELVKDIDVQEVRDKNISSEKINSIYNDVNTAKSFIKWYLIIAGAVGGIVLILLLYYLINVIFVW